MLTAPRSWPAESSGRQGRLQWLGEWGLIFAIFIWHAAWPVPDTNEPDYVGKAFHYWNPQWGAGDVFLESANPHLLFYLTFGPLTQLFSLTVATWLGRLITWGLLAAGWLYLSRGMLQQRWWSVLSAGLFVTLTVHAHVAGEWVVGGCEPKGFAYVLLLFGLGQLIRGRWNVALALLGGAASFHVLVGGWSVVALAGAWLFSGKHRPALRSLLPGLAIGGLLALVGVVPALVMNEGLSAELRAQANIIYVYYRLPHHLVPSAFGWLFWARGIALVLVWLTFVCMMRGGEKQRVLSGFVGGAIAIALAGVMITVLTPFGSAVQASLLRWYWFRLADAVVPLGVALLATALAVQLAQRRPGWGIAWSGMLIVACGLHLAEYLPYRLAPSRPRADAVGRIENFTDWLATCEWVREHTPTEALFITPRLNQTFKWRTGRAEVATWKDLPQDATAILLWWERMLTLHTERTADGQLVWRYRLSTLPTEQVIALGEQMQADYLLTERFPRLELPLEYQNNTYAVYRLPQAGGE